MGCSGLLKTRFCQNMGFVWEEYGILLENMGFVWEEYGFWMGSLFLGDSDKKISIYLDSDVSKSSNCLTKVVQEAVSV